MDRRVACIQMACEPLNPSENLAKAESLVKQAVAQGASLVLLPEFLTTGCLYDRRLREFAEPVGGATTQRFSELSRSVGAWIGAGLVESEDNRVYSTLVLCGPAGEIHSYRKRYIPFFEKLYLSGGSDSGIVETPLGRIGMMICWDMVHRRPLEQLRSRVDLLLICSAWPDLTVGNIPLWGFQSWISRQPHVRPPQLARELGTPVLYCNTVGPWTTHVPGTLLTYRARFSGASAVVGSDGQAIAVAGDDETVLIADVPAIERAPRIAA